MRPKIDWWMVLFAALAIGNGIGWSVTLQRLDHTQKLLTKTVEECGEAWLAQPLKEGN